LGETAPAAPLLTSPACPANVVRTYLAQHAVLRAQAQGPAAAAQRTWAPAAQHAHAPAPGRAPPARSGPASPMSGSSPAATMELPRAQARGRKRLKP